VVVRSSAEAENFELWLTGYVRCYGRRSYLITSK